MKILLTRDIKNNKNEPVLNEHVHNNIRISAYDDNRLELSYTTHGSSDYVGNIYVGHVENIVKNIDAAFVRFKSDSSNVKDNIGYLALKDVIPECIVSRKEEASPQLKNGDIVLVQVKKPAVKTKQVVLTTRLSISGRYAAITLGQKGCGCSKKLSEDKRKDIIAILKHDFSIRERISDKYGLIARTECAGLLDQKLAQQKEISDDEKLSASDILHNDISHNDVPHKDVSHNDLPHNKLYKNPFEDVRHEVDLLCDKIDEILSFGATRVVATCLYEIAGDIDFSDKIYRCFNYHNLKSACNNVTSSDIEVVTDNADLFTMYNASSFHANHPEVPARLLTSKDGTIEMLYGLSTDLEKAGQKRVWLDSGAYLVIESTEAMHVIDVNTGKAINKKGNHFLNINTEAAIESARQIRLRNFSGMVLIDFINMDDRKDYKTLENALNSELAMDPVSCKFVDFTKLGIAEITRIKKD